MATVCVFTPTYNRAYTLPKLYESLADQTSRDYSWLIVDDGSTDNTKELVQGWQETGTVPITYIHQENGGKQRAVNVGMEHCKDELFFVVDSDDYLVPTAVEQIVDVWNTVRDDQTLAGIVALRGTDEDTPLGTRMPAGISRVKMWDLLHKYHFAGDTSLIHRTDIVRQHPYQVAPGEKFIAESSAFYAIDDEYDMYTYDHVLTICHYLPDGLTHNFVENTKKNPIGYMRHKRDSARRSTNLRDKCRETTLYLVGCMLAHHRGGVREAPSVPIAVLCYLPAKLARVTVFR